MMSSAAVPLKTFRATRKPFRAPAKTVRLPAGIAVRLQPGIPFAFTPESFSRSPRNPFRLAPESAEKLTLKEAIIIMHGSGFSRAVAVKADDGSIVFLEAGLVNPRTMHMLEAEALEPRMLAPAGGKRNL
jgi:hypothetical protein